MMSLILESTLPINKEKILQHLKAKNFERFTCEEKEISYSQIPLFVIRIKTPVPGTRISATIDLDFHEFLPNSLNLHSLYIFDAANFNKNQLTKTKEMIYSWFTEDVFEENPSPNQDIGKIKANHLNNWRDWQYQSFTGDAIIENDVNSNDLEDLFFIKPETSYDVCPEGIFYFYNGAIYLKEHIFTQDIYKELLIDENGEKYLKCFEWDGESPLNCFHVSQRTGLFEVRLGYFDKGVDYTQLSTILNQPLGVQCVQHDSEDSSSYSKIEVYSERLFRTSGVPTFEVGEIVNVLPSIYDYSEKGFMRVEKVLDYGFYQLLHEARSFKPERTPKESELTSPILFNRLEKMENIQLDEHVGQYAIRSKGNNFHIYLISEEHPNYYFLKSATKNDDVKSIVVLKSEVEVICPTLEDAELKLVELSNKTEVEIMTLLEKGATKVHQMLKLFIENLNDDELKKQIINYTSSQLSRDDEENTENKAVKKSLEYAVICLNKKY